MVTLSHQQNPKKMQPLLKFPADNLGKTYPVKDQVVCLCYDVPASAVREAVDVSGARTVEEVATLTRAGSSCGACKCRVERLVAGCLPSADHAAFATRLWLYHEILQLSQRLMANKLGFLIIEENYERTRPSHRSPQRRSDH